MKIANRIIVNTIVLYAKIIICMVISLLTVPIVLHVLGKNDYGLFTVIAGVIAMLSFINGSMTISTQRYLSVSMGEGNNKKLSEVYNLSIILHLLIAITVAAAIEILMPYLLNHILTIEPDRIDAARSLFHFLVLSMFFTILTVPFDALMNAYEDMLSFSVFSIIEAVLRLIVALALFYVTTDKLTFYGAGISIVAILLFIGKYLFSIRKYAQLRLSLSFCHNWQLFKEMFGFAGWNTLSALAIVSRSQGISVVFNHYWGSAINAAYGVGYSVNGVLNYFSTTIQKSVNPQLMMSEGMHQRDRLVNMSFALTKFSCLCLGIVALPLLIEMPTVLQVWLHDVPTYSIEFTRIIIILSLLYQASAGLMSAIQSTGIIKWYTITVCLLLTAVLPLAVWFIQMGQSPVTTLWLVCLSELIAFFARLFYARRILQFPIWNYCKTIVLPQVAMYVLVVILLLALTKLMPPSIGRVLLITIADVALVALFSWHFILKKEEKQFVLQFFNKKGICK